MGMCFVPDCKHYSESHRCHFFRFPLDQKLRNKWIINIRRNDRSPSKSSKVCSCHFKDGNKNGLPVIFERNKDKMFPHKSQEIKHRKRSNINMNQAASFDVTDLAPSVDATDSDVSLDATDPAASLDEAALAVSFNAASPAIAVHDMEDGIIAAPFPGIEGIPSTSGMNPVEDFEKYLLEKENVQLKSKIDELEKHPFNFQLISKDEKKVKYYTGLENSETFGIVLSMCTREDINYYAGWKVEGISYEDQLLITLMKLKLNAGHIDLSTRFGVSIGTISNIVLTWVHLLHEIFFIGMMNEIPSTFKNRNCLPACFSKFSNCRIIIDCTEINTDVPKRMDHQRLFYSNYKHRNTMKALIGIAPNGVVTYVSDMYPGSVSDKDVFKSSNIYEQLEPGDLILADKGFLITDLVPPGVSVNIPPFLFSPQFTPSEVEETKNIARARVHVERAIRRIKVFRITKCIPKVYFRYASKVFQVCAALTNLQAPLLREVKDSFF